MGYCDDMEFMWEYDWVVFYVDGAWSNNGRWNAAAGYGIFWGDDHPLNRAAPVKGRPTNSTGEIQGITRAIWDAVNKADIQIDQLRIKTDSMFVINAVYKWMWKWKQNNWCRSNGLPVVNKYDFIALDRAMRQNSHMDIEIVHVPGHQGEYGNEAADELAREGVQMYRERYLD